MSSPEVLSSTTREQFATERQKVVTSHLGSLINPFIEDNPYLRVSFPEVVMAISESSGIAKALVSEALSRISEEKTPVAGDNLTMAKKLEEGKVSLQLTPIENPVQPLEDVLVIDS